MTYKEQLEVEMESIIKLVKVKATLNEVAAYVLKAKAEAWEEGYRKGGASGWTGKDLSEILQDHLQKQGLIPTELKAEGQNGK